MGSDRFPSIVALRPRARSAHVRLVGGSDLARQANGRRAVQRTEVGTLVALPILTTPDGTPFDLLEATTGSAVVLLFVPGDSTTIVGDRAAIAISLAGRVEAASGRLFVIAPRAEASADWSALLLDRDGGFAYSLGLADWDYERGCADLRRPVGLVLDEVGRVIAADLDGSPDLGRLIGALPKCSTAIHGRGRSW